MGDLLFLPYNALKGDILRTSEGKSQRTDEGGQRTGTGTKADYINLTNHRFFGDPSNLFLFGSFFNQSLFRGFSGEMVPLNIRWARFPALIIL